MPRRVSRRETCRAFAKLDAHKYELHTLYVFTFYAEIEHKHTNGTKKYVEAVC